MAAEIFAFSNTAGGRIFIGVNDAVRCGVYPAPMLLVSTCSSPTSPRRSCVQP
ncbi:RNA-binding domain-containing protein [Stenotrophomonas maltophilia]|uniref:RNA-binding domain-containing protein n=1 Tax=Stenotrophomonas maltophilia TaxID=40324 RepID=UPI001E44F080|nr:RNA-binding domain-containing protein [Stenotrophomonas maltophilia]